MQSTVEELIIFIVRQIYGEMVYYMMPRCVRTDAVYKMHSRVGCGMNANNNKNTCRFSHVIKKKAVKVPAALS